MSDIDHLKFGDIVENGFASVKNPQRIGVFVKYFYRAGQLNPGRFIECTDTKGNFWTTPITSDSRIGIIGKWPQDWNPND